MELLRPSSLAELDGGLAIHGGTEVVPLLRDGILQAERLVDIRGVVPRGVDGNVIGAGTTLAELEASTHDPGRAPRGLPPRRVAAAPQHGLGRRQPAPVDALLVLAARVPVPPARRRPLPRARGRAPRACDLRERLLRVGAPVRHRGGAARPRRTHPHDDARELPLAELYRLPDEGDRDIVTLEPGELILELELPEVEASTYLKAMDRKRWAFPQVGVAAARVGGEVRIALAGVAPIPWLLGPDGTRRGDAAAAAPPGRSRSRGRSWPRRSRARTALESRLSWGCGSSLSSRRRGSACLARLQPRPRTARRAARRRSAHPGAARRRASRRPAAARSRRDSGRAFLRAAHDTGFQLSMLVAVAQVESRVQAERALDAPTRAACCRSMPATAAS